MNTDFQVKTISKNNRGLFTLRTYKKWDKVMSLQPICLVTLRNNKSTNCGYCLMQAQLFRCCKCHSFYYCSKECQQADWSIHRLECNAYEKMTKNKNLSVLKQLTSQFMLNVRLWLMLQNNQELSKQFHNMVSMQDHQTPQKVHFFQQMSVMIMQNLGLQKNESNMSKIFRQVNILNVNVFTVQQLVTTKDGAALGLYSPANYINHECQSNCQQYFDGRQFNIVASTDIQLGQQLTISYVNLLNTYQQRQSILKSSYFFQCFCQLCQAQKMLNTEIYYLMCPKCKNNKLYLEPKDESQTNSQRQYSCQSCLTKYQSQQITALKEQVKQLQEKLRVADYKEGKKKFFQLRKIVNFKHPLFAKAIEHLYRKAIEKVNCAQQQQTKTKIMQEAYILLKQCLNNLQKWYKTNDERLIFMITYSQMCILAYNLNKKKVAFINSQKAYDLLMKIQPKHITKEIKQIFERHQELKIEVSFAKSSLHKQ